MISSEKYKQHLMTICLRKKVILNKGFKNEVKSFVLLNQYLSIYDILGMIS